MRVQSVNLNLIPTGVMPIVHLSQYDRDADGALLFNIFNGPTPYNLTGCTATINGTKPDGNVYTYPCTVHSNFLTSAVYDQMTTVQGTHEAEIRISDGDSVVGTLNFQMAIEKAGVSEIDVSHTDVPTLLENIQASVDEAEYWAEQAAGAVAGVASFNGRHGSVLPVAGDYDASQISYGDRTVEDALDGMGGHTILNASGQEMPQRKNLRFAGANLSDDAQNDTTNVTITGGSGGSTITVTTIETTLYGETVTITDGTSTFTGVFDNSGVCVIDGVTATGTLTVSSGAASRTLNVPYFGNYTVALSFWAATINVSTDPGVNSAIVKKDGVNVGTISFSAGTGTYIAGSTGAYTFTATVGGVEFTSPTVNVTEQTTYSTTIDIFSATLNISTSASSLYGKTITIKKGSTVVGTTTFSAQGSASYTVHETGTYTLTCEGHDASVTVSAEQTYNVTINSTPDGETVTPVNDVEIWLACANLSSTGYTTMSQILADSSTLAALIADANAVKYMVRSTGFATDICGNSGAMSLIGLNNNCANSLLANSTWATAICNSTYFESVLNVKVPTMTANNAPYGECVGTAGQSGSYDLCKAFDGDTTTIWNTAAGLTTATIGYHFLNPVNVRKIQYMAFNASSPSQYGNSHNLTLEHSNDGTNYTAISGATFNVAANQCKTELEFTSDNNIYAPYWIIRFSDSNYVNGGSRYILTASLQFYGRDSV